MAFSIDERLYENKSQNVLKMIVEAFVVKDHAVNV